jgi:transposase
VSERPHRVRTWAPKGKTPVLQYSFTWNQLSAVAGITFWNIYFKLVKGTIRAPEIESEGGDIKLEFLPAYAPELNPVEYLWAHWKQHEMPNFCPKDFAELSAFARAKLKRTQRRKTLVAAFWKQAELPF